MTSESGPRLGAAEKGRLAVEVLVAYASARRAMRSNRIVEADGRMKAVPASKAVAAERRREAALHAASATRRVLERLPTDDRCLVRSLVLTRLLHRRAVPSVLVLAVRPGADFSAHAWVEVEGRPLLPPGDASMERLLEL